MRTRSSTIRRIALGFSVVILAIAVGPPLGARLATRFRAPTRETRIAVIGSIERREAARSALAGRALREALGDPDRSLRWFAVEAVLGFGAEALEPLVETLEALPRERRDEALVTSVLATTARAVDETESPAVRLGFAATRCGDPAPDSTALAVVDPARREVARAAWAEAHRERCRFFTRLLREDGLLVALTGPDDVRQVAAETLASLRTEPSAAVVEMLGDSKIHAAFVSAREGLSKIVHGHPDSPLDDAMERVRAALATTPEPALDLTAALGSLAAHGRGRFFAAAVRSGDAATRVLERVLALDDPDLRHWAAWALRELSSPVLGSSALAARAADPDPELRRHATIALARHASSVDERIAVLGAALADPAPAVRGDAARELAAAGAAGVTTLGSALASAEDERRTELARALGAAGPLDGAVSALAATLASADPWTAGAAETALAEAGAVGVDAMASLARSGDAAARRRALAVVALARLARPSAPVLTLLGEALDDDDVQVRRCAAAALAAVDPAVRTSLSGALDRHARLDADPGVRARASRAVAAPADGAMRS